ncbi:hypothetical protein [Cardinium endosymbiont of Sogatella furcifera]|uniref:hypothetical protein n=1 Tax=Cardinium endosymbiont of Sogatella furcifera TaxID=650378 RepID=UPI0013B43EDB|nr:hypothetical protein [Cardinium endosymbiont of Sogatella furcifera]
MVKFNYTITAQQGKRKCPIKQIITMLCGSLILLITIGCHSLNKGYGAGTCFVFGSRDILNYISVRKKMFNPILQLSVVTLERIFKQKQEQAIKRMIKRRIKLEIEQNIKQKLK